MAVLVQEKNFNLADEINQLKTADGATGAIISFIGIVRGDKSLKALELEHYPKMTFTALEEIKNKALKKWNLIDVRIVHRFGHLSLGEQIMMVAVAAPHRREAFEAADYIMDFLKSRAPFWKKEHGDNGSVWVNANPEDEKSLARW
ncbi:molybdenum cofactor biosynthesis protein MoaE [Amylibacter sp.]|nr:molybdenum cofactor biosynthesis protein MoaE [Amylibacter sp.]